MKISETNYYTLDEIIAKYNLAFNDWVVLYNSIFTTSTRSWSVNYETPFLNKLLGMIVNDYKRRDVYFTRHEDKLDVQALLTRITTSMDEFIPRINEYQQYIDATNPYKIKTETLNNDIIDTNTQMNGSYDVPQGTTDWSTLTSNNNHLSTLNRNVSERTQCAGNNLDKYNAVRAFIEDIYEEWLRKVTVYYYA